VIPPLLRRYAGLNSELVILGQDDHLEIWDHGRWQVAAEQVLASGSTWSEQLADLGLSL
jgi:DNA-binding transcriptional regulator/RsmH inhibitor MraZ